VSSFSIYLDAKNLKIFQIIFSEITLLPKSKEVELKILTEENKIMTSDLTLMALERRASSIRS
jgi:hypothetical protein